MEYQVTARGRRIYYIGLIVAQELLIGCIFIVAIARPGPVNVIVFCAVSVPVILYLVRACRSASLIATGQQVVVRGLAGSRSVPWQDIGSFTAATRPVRMASLPRTVQRRMLGIQLRSGRTFWLRDLSCRAGPKSGWVDQSAARLNELAAAYALQPGSPSS